ncbi:hypothetical protein Rhe02_53190 [Rhizocola hellebori]|uniref:Beta-carotene 15,15'-dioxygenase n=2 Tax=Rhizocola hellebori TaxID=1392758 RepID=A0A8J3QCR2_9ACTN|nr:hypothetical protein Rhe02_53190 [Rhizocola hellebori]
MLPPMTATAPALTRTAVNLPALGMAAAATVALAAALRAPLAATVAGFVVFGALHNVLELRYVLGRFAQVLTGRFLGVLVGLVTIIALCRLLALPRTEILVGYALLAAASLWCLKHRPLLLAAAIVLLAVAAAGSLAWPAHHFVVFTHLHNIVPLFFVWEWSRSPAVRAVCVGWVLVIPAALLAGAADSLIRVDGPVKFSPAATPLLDGQMAARLLAVFAFLQTMHYVVWVWLLPRYAPSATRRFEERVPALTGWRAWALGAIAACALALILLADYSTGRGVYASLATYHAYLEFPVLLALVFTLRKGQQS